MYTMHWIDIRERPPEKDDLVVIVVVDKNLKDVKDVDGKDFANRSFYVVRYREVMEEDVEEGGVFHAYKNLYKVGSFTFYPMFTVVPSKWVGKFEIEKWCKIDADITVALEQPEEMGRFEIMDI